jgi:hypothetical protein
MWLIYVLNIRNKSIRVKMNWNCECRDIAEWILTGLRLMETFYE